MTSKRYEYMALAIVLALTAVAGAVSGGFIGNSIGKRSERALIHKEIKDLKGRMRHNRATWRSGVCSQTCRHLGFRTLNWTTTVPEDMGHVRSEDVCRCGSPDGVLFVRDNGETHLVRNKRSEDANDWQDRKLREAERAACGCGMLDEQYCKILGVSWRNGR